MEARAGRDDAKRSLAANVDPSAIKRERKRAAKIASGNTFEAVALECAARSDFRRVKGYCSVRLTLVESSGDAMKQRDYERLAEQCSAQADAMQPGMLC